MRHDPYVTLPPAPSFRITSRDVLDDKPMPRHTVGEGAGGANQSPQLAWYGFPPETRSFVVTMYDADAPTPSGFWHWVVKDIPVTVTELNQGAGSRGDASLPDGASHLRNDAGARSYLGPAPPPGHGSHRFFIAVHAVDVETLGGDADASPAYLHLDLLGHTLARAVIAPRCGQESVADGRASVL
jgi:Raf kinase inhibitor-like YbhB/YbcL family protein